MTHWDHPLLLDDTGMQEVWGRPSVDPILFVCGSGFDPRATSALDILRRATNRRIDGWMVELPEAATDLAVRPRASANHARIEQSVKESGGQLYRQPLPEFHDTRSLGRLISRHFQAARVIDGYRDVVLEISAMPRSVFFPLVRGVLQRAHLVSGEPLAWRGDLHVCVCENPEIDGTILEEGTTPMAPIGGFAPRGDPAATTIWVPVLGERASARVKALYDELEPDETCPVLPWPSRDPRRGDRLMLEYRRLLFEEIRLEPRNVIYAAERNPFDLYRTLGALHERYMTALGPLGTVSMVISSHSSKLLSVGVLLTAYEHDLVVQHVSPGTYGLHPGADELRRHDEVYDLWLTGEPY